MKKKHRKSFVLKLAAVVFALYIITTLVFLSFQIRQSNEQLDRLKTQVANQEEQNAQTKRVLAQDDEQFMESVARNDLGYAKPSERIFVDASGN